MKVAKIMSSDVHIASPNDSVEEIARIMASEDIGFLPVGENDRLIGTITDRDIVIRGVASGKDGDARVRDVMTREVKYCFSDEEIDHVIENMGDLQIRRLPVINRDKRLVGVVSLADAALKHDPEATGSALTGVVEPGGHHTQMQ
ncbi:MAG: CBS domain-containing protein [Rhodospirillaceae bacterium]|nr:MAG: CBS domain-containing protein [Rhodospirillaceae bacterium]